MCVAKVEVRREANRQQGYLGARGVHPIVLDVIGHPVRTGETVQALEKVIGSAVLLEDDHDVLDLRGKLSVGDGSN
jgi:hypothetical protein